MSVRPFTWIKHLFAAVLLAGAGAMSAKAAEESDALMLVATPDFVDPLYGASVLVAWPIGNGQFLGFILNKPTTVTLADAFPRHKPSVKAKSTIFLGGPERSNSLFALVRGEKSPGKGAIRIASDLHVVVAGETVDAVIERDPEHARFLVGTVVWQRGELEHEIKLGAWYVASPETDVLMRKDTKSLWKELVEKQGERRNAI
jgi:putative transcriptional regulator